LSIGTVSAADYPKIELSTKKLKLTCYPPDAEKGFYRGSRFCWGGVMGDVEVGGFKLFHAWKDKHDPTNNDDIIGPVIEFGQDSPLGYAEAKVGEPFVKIGVGELTKPKEEKYSFFTNYKVANPGVWRVKHAKKDKPDDPDDIEFRQTVISKTGYSYHLVVGIRIYQTSVGNFLALNYELINVGTKKIVTDVYNHNFFNVDKQPIGPKYHIGFREPVESTADSTFGDRATVLTKDRFPHARFIETALTFPKPLQKQAAFGRIVSTKEKTPYAGGFAMSFTESENKYVDTYVDMDAGSFTPGDKPPKKFQVWSISTVMCPEPFYDISLEPSESIKWRTKYLFVTSETAINK
jgi:hypothetical protein